MQFEYHCDSHDKGDKVILYRFENFDCLSYKLRRLSYNLFENNFKKMSKYFVFHAVHRRELLVTEEKL